MKLCPYCAEQIQDEDVVCRSCGRDPEIEEATRVAEPSGVAMRQPGNRRNNLKLLRGLFALVLVGISVFGAWHFYNNSQKVSTYLEALREIDLDYDRAAEGLTLQSRRLNQNMFLLLAPEWKDESYVYLDVILKANEKLRALEPPSAYAAAHAERLNAADHADRAVDLYIMGMEDVLSNGLNEASDAMYQATQAMERAAALMP